MTALRTLSLVLLSAIALAAGACGGAAPSPAPVGSPSPSPTPSLGGPVRTEAEAVARVVAHERRFTGIRARDPDLIGQAAWYEVAPASGVGAFIVSMRLGWGDCPSGCLDEHSWLYAVSPDGSVTLQSEGGSAVPPDAWPAPGGGGTGQTGVHITAVAGPTCPVETVPPDPACAPRPVPNAVVTIVGDAGAQEQPIILDAAGQAFAALEPGVYTVNGQGVAGLMNGPEAQRVVVEEGKVSEVVLAYDTGIR
jgi:hypothetical protein